MFKSKKILVIGDIMLDIYYKGDVDRISPEAPVPVFKKINEKCVLGGASNVAANLAFANQKTSVMALVGEDSYGKKIRDLFAEIGVDSTLVGNWDRPTITKTRFLAENNQQILRLDIEDSHDISDELEEELLLKLEKTIEQFDWILISDYMKGLLTENFTQNVIKLAKKFGKKVLADIKDSNFKKYKGAYLLKPNQKELQNITKMPVSTDEELFHAAKYLLQETECEYVLTTCGAKGMVLVGENFIRRLDTVGRSVYDVTGAGDTTIAYLAASLANGIDIVEAMKIANYAAGLQVGKVGTSIVYLHEVEESMRSGGGYRHQKVFRMNERNTLKNQIIEWRKKGETVVTTNGCFDIIHIGHIALLEEAKKYGDHLIVLINTDASVRRLKGADRPINTEEDRATVIAALDCVDAVMLFDPLIDNIIISDEEYSRFTPELQKVAHEAPMGAAKIISPDVHVKGGDYTVDQVPEAIYAKEFHSVPYVQGYSTTKTIEKSRAK